MQENRIRIILALLVIPGGIFGYEFGQWALSSIYSEWISAIIISGCIIYLGISATNGFE